MVSTVERDVSVTLLLLFFPNRRGFNSFSSPRNWFLPLL